MYDILFDWNANVLQYTQTLINSTNKYMGLAITWNIFMLLWTPAASELQEVCVYAVLSVQAPFRLEKLVLFATFVCNLWLILRVLIRDGLFFNVTKLSARSTSEIGSPLCTNLLRLSCTPRISSLLRLLQGCRAWCLLIFFKRYILTLTKSPT